CDRYIGIKIPAMMHDLGLKDIDIRVNEKCTMRFVNPKDITRPDKNEIRKNIAEYFLKIGLSDADADDYAEDSMKFHNFMSRQTSEVINIKTPAWVISYGTKMSK
ncbi:MAG: hypothetical protein FWB71_03590, partial [Defluviitaleaceae bacterium]|nr:hypothetical protein [Defluviitaleaceae bacterium]